MIIVEDGTKVPNANSYVGLAEANAYIATYNPEASWDPDDTDGLSTAALIQAALAIDANYGQQYISYIDYNSTQSLLWPRQQTNDKNGRPISSTTIPQSLKNAQIEIALMALNGEDIYADTSSAGLVTSESFTVSSISVSATYASPVSKATYEGYTKVERILKPLLKSNGSNFTVLL